MTKKVKKVKKKKKVKWGEAQRTEPAMRSLMAKLSLRLAEGKTPEEICEELGLRFQDYNIYVDRLKAQEVAEVTGKTELDRYLEYCRSQGKLIRDMENLKDDFKKSKQYNALVGATRLQSDIYDKMIKTGQELGIITKTPESVNIIGGLDIRSMSDVQIRNQIRMELEKGQELLGVKKKKKALPVKVLGPDREKLDLEDAETEGEA